MTKRLHVKYPLLSSDFNETWILSKDFRRNSNIKLHQNPSSESRVAPRGQTDMTKLIVAFRSFANAPKKAHCTLYPLSRPARVVPSPHTLPLELPCWREAQVLSSLTDARSDCRWHQHLTDSATRSVGRSRRTSWDLYVKPHGGMWLATVVT